VVTTRVARGDLPVADPKIHCVGYKEDDRWLKQLRLLERFGLRPDASVLEIGCGLGGLAYELASYLDVGARYRGFDVAPDAIAWLQAHYAPVLPDFRFDLIDVQNPRYRSDGTTAPEEVRFHYPDASFDFVCAFEVFMHMELDGVRNYVAEIARVLRPGGNAAMSFQAIWEFEDEPKPIGEPRFVHIGGGVHTKLPEERGMSMGYRVDLIRGLFASSGLEIVEEVEGRWHRPFTPRPPGSPIHNCDLFAVRRSSQ
jgi:SAM-dependent methyltransferase